MSSFDTLVAEGAAVDVSRWGDGFLGGRHHEEALPWRYPDVARPYLADAGALLDLGTGDGSRLLELAPLPPRAVACENWAPTVPAASATLRPAGVALVRCADAPENTTRADTTGTLPLPFRDGTFDVVTDRHSSFDPHEVGRVLRPGGVFVTQQVGTRVTAELRALLGRPPDVPPWHLGIARAQVEAAGLTVVGSGEADVRMWWDDVGALVAYLRSVPWEVPDFDVDRDRDRLRELHTANRMSVAFHAFWLAAGKAS